jgi:hypothetical protein
MGCTMSPVTNKIITKVVKQTLEQFCNEFKNDPYISYNESGIHAWFYYKLMDNFEKNGIPLFDELQGEKISLIQREYKTAIGYNKSRPGHWDISILNYPLKIRSYMEENAKPYDHLEINAIIEFGLNASIDHMYNDIDRMNNTRAIIPNKFIVHLIRESVKFCGRDISAKPRKEKIDNRQIMEQLKDGVNAIYYVHTIKNKHGEAKALIITKKGTVEI